MALSLHDVDPFDLPDWLGTDEVTWLAEAGVRDTWRVAGRLSGTGGEEQSCDLVAVDLAYPAPVVVDDVRVRAHQSWQHGQVLVQGEGSPPRMLLAVPGTGFTADLVLDAVERVARAVGADPARYAVHLRIGRERG